jgi:hypothetical protein
VKISQERFINIPQGYDYWLSAFIFPAIPERIHILPLCAPG